MNLVIDIGNSRIKTAIFEKGQIVDITAFNDITTFYKKLVSRKHKKISDCIVASTGIFDKEVRAYLIGLFPNFIELNGYTHLPFKNRYKTKETQGSDRIAAIAGACFQFPEENILIIDAGTAITFDFIDHSGNYLGGNISPGMEMRFKALNTFTEKLPLLNRKESANLLGKTTQDAIICGVQNSMIFEIEQYVVALSSIYKNLRTIMTGGDAEFFANKLKSTIFVDLNLVLIGLNRILEYNVGE